jgi:glycosyltransferase involved in cell wall biosynthesis
MMGCKHIAISNSVKNNEKIRFHNPSELIWNWFDAQYYKPPSEKEKSHAREKLGISLDKEVLVSIGNGSDVKNYIEIVRMLKKIQDPGLYYLQVGFEHLEKKDKREAEALGISEQIRWCGPREDVRDYLWAADSYFMPSIFEGFGIAAVEALACGLPCFLANVPGLKDLSQLGVQAFWVGPASDSLVANYKEQKFKPWDQGERNSKLVREFFSVDKGAASYLRAWEKS